jgi:ABC-2 type transport system ATP-binding protein/lipopolysaccharide transport system ATP-binding protein
MNLKRRLIGQIFGMRDSKKTVNALVDFSHTFVEGDRYAIIGQNGAGKSTLLRVLAGVIYPVTGWVERHGRLGSLLGDASSMLDSEATGDENCRLILGMLSRDYRVSKDKILRIREFSQLGDRFEDPVSTYSTGMQARLRISILLETQSEILVLDEGLASVDASFDAFAYSRLKAFLDLPAIVICATHSMNFAINNFNKGIWLENGNLRMCGNVSDVVSAYQRAIG